MELPTTIKHTVPRRTSTPTPTVEAPPAAPRQAPTREAAPPPPPPSPVARPVVAPPPLPAPRIQLLTVSKAIVGVAEVTGQGCTPGAPVSVTVDREPVGETVADKNGDFTTEFSTATMPSGQRAVQALCGPTLNAALDILLVSEVGTPGPTVTMILLLLLVVGWLLGRGVSLTKGSAR